MERQWCLKLNRHLDLDNELDSLERALKQGIIATKQPDGSYIVTSSNGVDTYRVSDNMCVCTGFWRWHYCKHLALVHELQRKAGDIIKCEVCGRWLLINPPMTADEWGNLHNDA